jgi:uncharacterized damage-inducible protein DinB
MSRYDFLVQTYATERLKTLSAWSQVPEARMHARIETRARSPLEHMVHQCMSEDAWMQNLGIASGRPATPEMETRLEFMRHYAACSDARLRALTVQSDPWFEEDVAFFGERRSRAWVLTRRIAHSAHHRGQLLACLRLWGVPLYSTYGPTADTGGLPRNGADVIYRYPSIDRLLSGEAHGGEYPPLPDPGVAPVTERPASS